MNQLQKYLGKGKTAGGLIILAIFSILAERAQSKGVDIGSPESLVGLGGQAVGFLTVLVGVISKIMRAEDRETELYKEFRQLRKAVTPPPADQSP